MRLISPPEHALCRALVLSSSSSLSAAATIACTWSAAVAKAEWILNHTHERKLSVKIHAAVDRAEFTRDLNSRSQAAACLLE